MSRPKRNRKICVPPSMQGFKPFGMQKCNKDVEILLLEEYESVRLLDYELLTQEQAAERINVSQPTLTRIYKKARKTMAKVLIEGKTLIIKGGNVEFENEWYRCKKCYKLIEGVENHTKCKKCTTYGQNELICISQTK